MAATSTLSQILQQLANETGFGYVLPSYTGTTTTLTLANSYGSGPFTGAKFPVGSPVIVTSTTGLGDMTFISNYVPSTGVFTVNPAITTASTDAIIVTEKEIDHPKRLLEAVDRTMNNRLQRWQRTPLTFVPDGDLRGTTVTDYWTGTAATPTYVTPTFPAGSAAAAFGFSGMSRVLQSLTSNATNRVTSNKINVALNSTVTGYQWYFQTAIRVVSGTGNAQIQVWNETGTPSQVTVNVIYGDNQTHATNSLGFLNMEGTMNLPATCKQISFRLISDSDTTTIQMTPLVAYPVDAMSFPIPNRVISQDYIGNFHYAIPLGGTSGPYNIAWSEPITTAGFTHQLENYGDHFTVNFNFRPTRPVYFDELTSDPSLSALTSTTSFPLDYAVKWAKFELLNMLLEREKPQYIPYGTRAIPRPSQWLQKRNAALRSAMNCEYAPEMIDVKGRV